MSVEKFTNRERVNFSTDILGRPKMSVEKSTSPKSCKLSVFDRIFTRIGGADNLSKGESTFYIELNETSSILHNATKNSFIIIDELGRGTSTYDGTAIAYAVYQRLTEISALSIVSTHYHKMIENIKENPEIIGKMQLKFMQCHEERDPERENKIINVDYFV